MRRILVTGATGYVGGRLRSRLEAAGHPVRCMARHPDHLLPKVALHTEVVRGDVLDVESLRSALDGIHTAYYLVHSMNAGSEFEARDREGARNFAAVARAAGVKRIIYLGGLGRDDADLSPHLRSRNEVGQILRESGVVTLEFRASIILGSGSLSFEMIRSLVERLPVMVTPNWVRVKAQPIAIRDVLDYLIAALDFETEESRVFEAGGADQVSYGDLMQEYARLRGIRRIMVPVPVLTPWLSSLWLGLVTPLYARIGRKLIESIRNSTVVHDTSALAAFPNIRPRGASEAIAAALDIEEQEMIETRWYDAVSSAGLARSWAGVRFRNRILDSRTLEVAETAEQAFEPIRRIGGQRGWYAYDWMWRLRGGIDLLLGGVGMRRGRRSPDNVRVGDALDFWRVEAYEPDRRLRLAAEMKVPGRAWLEFHVEPTRSGSTIRQTAIYDPVGFLGMMYWYALFPVHALVFSGMIRGIARAARNAPLLLLLGLALALPAKSSAGDTMQTPTVLIEFNGDSPGTWRVVNDGVMGGLSQSRIVRTEEGTGLFDGRLSLENNGGFASVRASLPDLDLGEHRSVVLRVRGDGRRYQLRFRTDDRFDGMAYRAFFETEAGKWTTVRIPFDEFRATFRGRVFEDAAPLDPARIHQVGLMLADKQPGDFALEIDWIQAESEASLSPEARP